MFSRIPALPSLIVSTTRLAPLALRNPSKAARFAALSQRPVIIGGCGRSGTSLLLSVLSCHQDLCAIPYETRALCPGGYTRFPDVDLGIRWDWLYRGYLDAAPTSDMVRWCEKTPRNVRSFKHLLKRFGSSARFIHLVRDGRDVVLSRHPRDRSRYYVSPQRWVEDVRAGLAVQDDPRVVQVRYEDLTRDLMGTMERLCSALRLEFAPETFDYPARARLQSHRAWDQAAKPVSASSVGKWKDPEYAARVAEFMRTPGVVPLLRRFGYEIDVNRT